MIVDCLFACNIHLRKVSIPYFDDFQWPKGIITLTVFVHFINFFVACKNECFLMCMYVCRETRKPVKTLIWFQHLTTTIEKLVPTNRQKSHAKDKQAPHPHILVNQNQNHTPPPPIAFFVPSASLPSACRSRNVPKSKVANEKLKCSYA